MKNVQIFIENQSRKDIKLKVDVGNICFLIFDCFQLDFGPILAPKMAESNQGNRFWKRSRPPSGLQRPSGPYLGPFWDRFGNMFKEFLVNFDQNYVCFTLFHKDSSVQGASAGNAKRKQFGYQRGQTQNKTRSCPKTKSESKNGSR